VREAAAPPTTSLNAYDLYLLARAQLVLRLPDSVRKSVDLMEQAVRLDPKFARAHAHLGASLLFLRTMNEEATNEESSAWLRRAEVAIHEALALDPDLSEAYDAYGNLLRDTGRPGAEEAYKRAIELNSNNASAWHDYSVFLGNVAKRPSASAREIERSLALDPRQPVTWANYLNWVASKGQARYEQELARAIRTVGDMPGAVGRLTTGNSRGSCPSIGRCRGVSMR
jgi:tetratricopeptide (TPR) repeat protein